MEVAAGPEGVTGVAAAVAEEEEATGVEAVIGVVEKAVAAASVVGAAEAEAEGEVVVVVAAVSDCESSIGISSLTAESLFFESSSTSRSTVELERKRRMIKTCKSRGESHTHS